MQSNYNKGFSCRSISRIIQLIQSGNGSYSLESLTKDIVKLNATVKKDEIENTIFLLHEIGIIEEEKFKLYVQDNSVDLIKKLIHNKLADDGVFELLATLSNISGDDVLIDSIQLYFANHAGVLEILIFIDAIKSSSDGYILNKAIGRSWVKTPDQLKAEIEAQEERGEKAEIYILEKECGRLKNHPKINLIKRVSLENVSEGYDIQSFQSLQSLTIDKFIEVKSHFNSKRIFWSINEINTAAKMQENYSLYVVDSTKMNNKNYSHREIENPYDYFQMKKHIHTGKTDNYKIEPQNFIITLL